METTVEAQMDTQMLNESLRKVYDWFDSDRSSKKNITEEFEDLYRLYKGDHWDLTGPDGRPIRSQEQKSMRPNTVENIAFAMIEGLVAEFSSEMDLIDYPVEQNDDEIAGVMTDLKSFIMYKNRVENEKARWLRWFFLYGTGIWHTYWDPHWRGGRGPNRWIGEIRWQALHPQALFPDGRCMDSLEDGRRVHKAYYTTQEDVKERWGLDVEADIISADMLIGDEAEGEVLAEQGEEMVLLVETWYKGEPLFMDEGEENLGPGLHVVWWAGDGRPEYLAHSNYVYFDPGEDCKFPFHVQNCYPRENSIWGFGEGHFIKSPQIMRNRTSELILEAHMHHSLGQTFYKDDAFTPQQKKYFEKYGTLAGMYFPIRNPEAVNRVHGQNAPGSLLNETERLQKVVEAIVGRFDISQGRTPGSVTAFRALDLLAERSQVRLRSKEQSLTTSYEDCGNYVNHLISQFYTERRAYRIIGDEIGKDDPVFVNRQTGEVIPARKGEQPPGPEWEPDVQKNKGPLYGLFRADMIQKAYIFATGESIPVEQFYPTMEMVEGEDYEIYSAEFDTVCQVSTEMPTDRMFYLEMAKELLANEVIDTETFYYVLKNGKFPPFEDMQEKAEQQSMERAEQEGEMNNLKMQMEMEEHQADVELKQAQAEKARAEIQAKITGTEAKAALDEAKAHETLYSAQERAREKEVMVHAQIENILNENPAMRQYFDSLSPENQRRVIEEMRSANLV